MSNSDKLSEEDRLAWLLSYNMCLTAENVRFFSTFLHEHGYLEAVSGWDISEVKKDFAAILPDNNRVEMVCGVCFRDSLFFKTLVESTREDNSD